MHHSEGKSNTWPDADYYQWCLPPTWAELLERHCPAAFNNRRAAETSLTSSPMHFRPTQSSDRWIWSFTSWQTPKLFLLKPIAVTHSGAMSHLLKSGQGHAELVSSITLHRQVPAGPNVSLSPFIHIFSVLDQTEIWKQQWLKLNLWTPIWLFSWEICISSLMKLKDGKS